VVVKKGRRLVLLRGGAEMKAKCP